MSRDIGGRNPDFAITVIQMGNRDGLSGIFSAVV